MPYYEQEKELKKDKICLKKDLAVQKKLNKGHTSQIEKLQEELQQLQQENAKVI